MGEALDLAEARLKGLGIVSAHSTPRHHGPRHPCAPCIVAWLRRAGRRLERTSIGKAAGARRGEQVASAAGGPSATGSPGHFYAADAPAGHRGESSDSDPASSCRDVTGPPRHEERGGGGPGEGADEDGAAGLRAHHVGGAPRVVGRRCGEQQQRVSARPSPRQSRAASGRKPSAGPSRFEWSSPERASGGIRPVHKPMR